MRQDSLTITYVRWRLPLLVSALVLILLVPYLLIRQWTENSQEADRWVRHTQQVESSTHSLEAMIRELDSIGLALGSGSSNPRLRQRLEETLARIDPQLRQLTELSRDNPGQQILIGRLQTLIERRIDVARRLSMGVTPAERLDLIDELYGKYQVRDLFTNFMANERSLLAERSAYADRQRERVRWLGLAALMAQLTLMGVVIYLLYRMEQRRADSEGEVRQASARALAVVQTVREPIVLLDRELRVLMHNTAFAELYADEDGDEHYERLDEIGHGAWRDPVIRQRLSEVLARGRELWDFEHVQRTADGVSRTMLLNARRMQLPDRDDDVALMTVSDISAQKAAQHRIGELNRQLEGKIEQVTEVNRELEAFSYSVSHDLRAPLRHVAGFADKLSRHLGDGIDEKGTHYLEVIGSSARRMSTLIDDLLVYSRLGRNAMKLQAVDMQSLVHETRAMLDANRQADAAEGVAAHRIDWRIAPLPVLVADENMMRQVWLNLLGNAVKYSARREPAVIEVACEVQEDGGHHFSVRDNGVGFDMEYAGKLFGVFQRLHKASDYPGTGIGLASVRRVVTRLGGKVWAESVPDQGSTFHFVLPPQDNISTGETFK
ncbi:ATP-binding protein [Pseudoxanthomonas daejeonensis]|uniref:sensor histidine kinase n=1 Tax=Pseudoxanthomonas daejeonensis TaxID=266062 RepID=UPI001F53F2DE|nr:ATP-binding protein [Pseudoxanthomonas daejeonensis]UNK57492.1 ATP-binding protein [Pseudoxanthomonas daejeonensis]